jgi:hypothetical protein
MIYRLIAGYEIYDVFGYKIKYIPPNRHVLWAAEEYWQECFDNFKYNKWIKEHETEGLLVKMGLWSSKKTEELSIVKDKPREIRIAMYESYQAGSPWKYLKKTLKKAIQKKSKLLSEKHCLDQYTVEGHCDWLQSQFLLERSYDMPYGVNCNDAILSRLMSVVAEQTITDSDFQAIIRSNLWSSYWQMSKLDMFDCKPQDLNIEQRTAASMATILSNSLESMNAPDDTVYNDSDLFEGWMACQRDKEKTDKLKSEIDKKVPAGKGKVFVVANERMTPKDIYNMNTPANKQRIKQMGK